MAEKWALTEDEHDKLVKSLIYERKMFIPTVVEVATDIKRKAYEQGQRDMWETMKCTCGGVTYFNCNLPKYWKSTECTFDTCPKRRGK